MVNKPHAPRPGNNKKKQPVAATANGEDTSYIVFGRDDGKEKKKNKPPESSASTAATRTKDGPPSSNTVDGAPPAEKKPDTRTLIAGASWTGKLPMTLFNEHCQKQRWEKPEYTVHRNGSGFTGGVLLKQKNSKTQEMTILPPILPPADYNKEQATQPSAVEARHFAAAYALFRVCNMKNIHMMLPPQYRDLWKGDFQDLKSAAVAQGHGYLYDADPFLAKKQHDAAHVAKEKARADKVKQSKEDEKLQVVSLDGQVQGKHVLKGWQRVPKVEMGTRTRREVERLVRAEGVWNVHEVRLSKQEVQKIADDLTGTGFRRSHVEEAAESCRDRDECLEWLLIHVPEDDLPKWALPENYLAGVSLASGDMKREGKLKRLAAAGYAWEVCSDVLDNCDGDENKAAEALQQRLMGSTEKKGNSAEISSAWDEEQVTLEAIFGDRYTNHDRICSIRLEIQTAAKKPILLRARPPSIAYPYELPILSVEADLPAYIRLSILKQCLTSADANFLGEQMLFNMIDWLEREIPAIIEKPGRLSEIASAASSSGQSTPKRAPSAKNTARRQPKPISWTPNTTVSQHMRASWTTKQTSPEQQKMLAVRQNLPAWKLQDAIVASVTNNQVTIISGETGSGKSTQSVQFILDDLIQRGYAESTNIICTQPRRISALGLADRVADERCGRVGDEVGYAIRGEAKQKAGTTKITFVTTGVLLRRLQTSGGSTADVVRSLADVSHVVIDEVHERSLDTDFLLVLLRDVLQKRQDLKLVLMSATLDADVFEKYFAGLSKVGKVEIEGRTHPVQDIYLDHIVQATGFGSRELDAEAEDVDQADDFDPRTNVGNGGGGSDAPAMSLGTALRAVGTRINYELIARTVQYIDAELGKQDGGILIFLPGLAEIDQTLRALRNIPSLHALPLHASLQSSDQRRVFQKPPNGLRKVIAATNVAETSITIEDIVAVIDTGRVKETSFDPANNMVKLAEVWASRAACKQRRGRAGRVRAGTCYKLYTRTAEAKMMERPDPEIRRVPLEQLCLSVKAMGVEDVPGFLASALTPPETLAVAGALDLLNRMGALDKNELTALGRHLSMIPADLRCGKLLVYGAAFGCLDACLTIAATLTVKSPFVNPATKRDEAKAARTAFGKNNGDLICDLRAFDEWTARRATGEPTSVVRRWCDENFLSTQTLQDISTTRTQYLASLQEIGFLPLGSSSTPPSSSSTPSAPINSNDALLRALIAASFHPQLARIDFPDQKYAASASGTVAIDPEARTLKFFAQGPTGASGTASTRVFIHPGSTLFAATSFPGSAAYVAFFSRLATSKVFLRDVTPAGVYALLLLGGPVAIDAQGRGLIVDGWLRMRGWARIGVLVSRLRGILDALLARKVLEPGLEMERSEVVRVVRRLVELEGLDR
nr:putative atp-dependent rna helicase ucp12 [Quercus suber]